MFELWELSLTSQIILDFAMIPDVAISRIQFESSHGGAQSASAVNKGYHCHWADLYNIQQHCSRFSVVELHQQGYNCDRDWDGVKSEGTERRETASVQEGQGLLWTVHAGLILDHRKLKQLGMIQDVKDQYLHQAHQVQMEIQMEMFRNANKNSPRTRWVRQFTVFRLLQVHILRLDLHYLYTDQAERELSRFMSYWQAVASPSVEVEIVTGRGKRSEGGKSILRPAVVGWLEARHYTYSLVNDGCLRVEIRRSRSWGIFILFIWKFVLKLLNKTFQCLSQRPTEDHYDWNFEQKTVRDLIVSYHDIQTYAESIFKNCFDIYSTVITYHVSK